MTDKSCPWNKNPCKEERCGVWSVERDMCGIPAVASALGMAVAHKKAGLIE